MPTGREIATTTLEAIEVNGGYIYGQSGATWTAAKQKNLEAKYNSDPQKYADYKYSAKYGKKWIDHRVWDCSGLTMWAAKQHGISYHHGSNSMYKYDASHKGELSKGMELPIGAYVYTGTKDSHPHIGTYTGDGLVTEAASTQLGCIQSKLTDKKWTYWSLGKGIEYDFIPGEDPSPTPEPTPTPTPVKHKTLRRGDKGLEVAEMQGLLIAHGESLPRYGIDGDFGRETEKAVKSFQRENGLVVDGICGPKTWAKLLA